MFGANKVNHEKRIKQFWVMTAITVNSAFGDPLGLSSIGGRGGSPQQQGQQAQQIADPFAPYRPQYSQQLNQLMQSPASVQQMPGYQAQMQQGTQAVQRQAAQQGGTQSGRELMALQDYASGQQNTWFQQQFQNLATLSGAGYSPATGGGIGVNAMTAGAQAQSRNIGALGGAIGQIGQMWNAGNTPTDPGNMGSTPFNMQYANSLASQPSGGFGGGQSATGWGW